MQCETRRELAAAAPFSLAFVLDGRLASGDEELSRLECSRGVGQSLGRLLDVAFDLLVPDDVGRGI
jgi:hypothetical protein